MRTHRSVGLCMHATIEGVTSAMSVDRNRGRFRNVSYDLLAISWLLLGAFAVVLGFLGFQEYFNSQGESRSFLTLVYLTLQLFFLVSGDLDGSVPVGLNVARFLAPFLMASATVAALLVVLLKIESVRIRLMSGHAIVSGLGEKGSLLVRSLGERDEEKGVVVIERDPDNQFLQAARLSGARVVIGDAREDKILRRAGAQRAAHLIAVCGDDGVNAEIAIQARSLSIGRRRSALTCSAHIVDPRVCVLLRRAELGGGGAPEFRLDFFSVFDSGATALLRDHPPFSEPPEPGGQGPHVAVVGLGQLGEAVIVRMAPTWRDMDAPAAERLRITMIDERAESTAKSLALRHPYLASTCDLIPRQVGLGSPEFARAEFLRSQEPDGRIGIVYVCVEDDTKAVSAALTLQPQLEPGTVPIVVIMARSGGLAGLIRQAETQAGFHNLHAFGLLDRTLTNDLLSGGTYETLARAIHEEYVRQQAAEGETSETNETMANWDDLPDSLKESNRAQAGHIGVKLGAADCALVPLHDDDAGAFEFAPAEVEQLAELEHDRWVRERKRDGWKFAQGEKDIARKTSPHMVAWDELNDDVREWDRVFVRGLPEFLHKAGFQIVRVKSQ